MLPPTVDLKKAAREKQIEELKKAAYARKINNQYKFLKKWNSGQITGMECCEAIENEGKIFRLDNDLFISNNKPIPENK